MTTYATPSDLWLLSLPPQSLFQDRRILSGSWTDPVLTSGTGTGTGLLTFDAASNPRDAYQVRVEVLRAGEVNVRGQVNFVGPPRLRVSLDGGATWAAGQTPDASGRIEVVNAPLPPTFSAVALECHGGGFTLQLENGPPGSAVNFGAGDAQLQVRATCGGLRLQIASGTELLARLDQQTGLALLFVTSATTAAQAAEYLSLSSGLPLVAVAGGTGAGVVQSAAAQALPFVAFAAGDTWTATTKASPTVLGALAVEADLARAYLRDTFTGTPDPVRSHGPGLTGLVCDKARWRLIVQAGASKDKDMEIYRPTDANQFLSDTADGTIQPTVTEDGPERLFPRFAPPVDPLTGMPI